MPLLLPLLLLPLLQPLATRTSVAEASKQNTWAVELIRPSEARNVAALHNCRLVNLLNLMDSHFAVMRCDNQFSDEKRTRRIRRHASVLWVEQQVAKVRVKRSAIPAAPLSFNDPAYSQQWYLKSGASGGHDLGVSAVWHQGISGRGTVVSILDDGIEHTHPDLKENYDPLASTDLNGGDSDPMPRPTFNNENKHGTRCAGEVAAKANNNVCSVGIAFNAKIGGVRMLDGPITDHVEASSLHHNQQHVDIYSASWGPDDDGRTVDGPGRLAKAAFEDGVTKGRAGLGNIFVWASGNGGQKSDSCACDGYTNSIYTLSVSSVSQHNSKPWYLEECASTLASTYSSGGIGEAQVVSTDLNGQCTNAHTGTSASAPIAAAILALVLEANPKLTWRDAQHITVLGADSSFLLDADWLQNQAGLKSSRKYGFGMMSAERMVQLAKMWTRPVPALINCPGKPVIVNRSLLPNGPLVVPVASDACGGTIGMLESVKLHVDMTATYRGQLKVWLVSPAGTRSLLLAPRSLDTNNGDCGFQQWPFMSVQFWRERPAGQWQVLIENVGGLLNSGTVKSVTLVLHGTAGEPLSLKRVSEPLPDWLVPYKHAMVDEYLCHSNCRSCRGPGQNNCTSCNPGLLLLQNLSVCTAGPACPAGYSQVANGNECTPCQMANCVACQSANNCRACKPGSGLLAAGQLGCVSDCPDGFYADRLTGRCLACYSANCTRCSGPRQCSRCQPDHLLLAGMDCPSACPAGRAFYPDSAGRACLPCSDNCDSCSGPGYNNCQACRPPLVPLLLSPGLGNRCVELPRLVGNKSMAIACQPAIQGCVSCLANVSGSACAACASGGLSLLHNGRCLSTCPKGLRACPRPDGSGGVCVACSSCSPDDCSSLPGLRCGLGSYATAEGACGKCHPDCRSCRGPGPGDCVSCRRGEACMLLTPAPILGAQRTFYGQCLRCCEPGVSALTYPSPSANSCVHCQPGEDSCLALAATDSPATTVPTIDTDADINADAQRVLYALLCIATVVVIVCLLAYCLCASANSHDLPRQRTASYSPLGQESPDKAINAADLASGVNTKL